MTPASTHEKLTQIHSQPQRATITAALLLCFLFLATAWVAEDAFISFRFADNFWNGYGLRWNIEERVQAFTHPLWMLLIVAIRGISKNLYIGITLASGLIFIATIYILQKQASGNGRPGAPLILATLSASIAFIDYSSSGLENPLTHIIIAGLAITYIKTPYKILLISFLACLASLNRPDIILLVLPAVLHSFFITYRKYNILNACAKIATGFSLLLIYLAASTFYYGAPLPNTALAKIGHGMGRIELINQGLSFIWENFKFDPATLSIIIITTITSIIKGSTQTRLISGGIIIYLGYIIIIGGDYMLGRFLSAPFIAAIAIIACTTTNNQISNKKIAILFSIAAIGLVFQITNISPKKLRDTSRPAA